MPNPFNRVLAALSSQERFELDRYGSERTLDVGRVLHRPEEAVEYVYFPINGMISLQVQVSGLFREVGFVGSEGMAGTSYDPNTRNSSAFSVVAVSGRAYRVPLDHFIRVTNEAPILRQMTLENLNRIGERAQQIAACNLSHRLETRLCRWIVQVLRHGQGDQVIEVTQEKLAELLGVNRARLNEAFQMLAQSGAVILQRRGMFAVADVAAIEASACDCARRKGFLENYSTLEGDLSIG